MNIFMYIQRESLQRMRVADANWCFSRFPCVFDFVGDFWTADAAFSGRRCSTCVSQMQHFRVADAVHACRRFTRYVCILTGVGGLLSSMSNTSRFT